MATKTTAATAMAGAQTGTINNQLKAVAATATKITISTATTTATTMMATVVAVTMGGSGGGPCRSRKLGRRGEDSENIHSWISLRDDLAFSHQQGIYGFNFPKRFLEISSRDLTSFFFS